MDKVRIQGLEKRFGGVPALSGIALAVAAGESLVLLGPSGAGKTVLLKSVAGLLRPDAGYILVNGQAPDWRRGAMDRLGVLFQRSALFDSLTVWENIAFRLRRQKKMSASAARAAAEQALHSVGLDAAAGALYPAELSGGMQKRVGFARAVAGAPDILLLDEPTAGLDPIMSSVIRRLIRQHVAALGATVIAVTSDIAGAREIGDRVAMLHAGRLRWTGPATQLDNSDNPWLVQFVNRRAEGPIDMEVADAGSPEDR